MQPGSGTSGVDGGQADARTDFTRTETDRNDGYPRKAKKVNRCSVCRKKVGLTGFDCRCGGLYCGAHRYSDEHDCTFDYKELGAQEIRRNNPLVVEEKINKI